jgi:transcriptional regulator with XRE-family HTH domain
MSRDSSTVPVRLGGHALRNANLRKRSLVRAQQAPPLARALVDLRARVLGMTRLEFARRSGLSRGTLRDLELGVHAPTRRTLQRFVAFCRECGVAAERLEEVYRLHAGSADGLAQLLARLELLAGSPAELARRAGISPATLWEYRRGNYPLPLPMLRRLCQVVGEDSTAAEVLWHEVERRRLRERGYPEALAAFWTLCSRSGHAEKHLPALGLGTPALRRLRYLELPPWPEVAGVARALCRTAAELQELEQLWQRDEQGQQRQLPDPFGALLQQCRKRRGLTRREVADLFGVGGKKPARIIKSIEEDGCYSARAHPAGLAALLAETTEEQSRLLQLWEQRRRQFHLRHRPETRTDLRLVRERYGFDYKDLEPILGYTPLEYQRLERGVGPLTDAARERILQAIERAGQQRVEALLQQRDARETERSSWQTPPSVRALIVRLARREGGIIPLTRYLRQSGVPGLWAARLRALARGEELPPWPLLERIGQACGVPDLSEVLQDWRTRYQARLQESERFPLGVEVRLLIAEVAMTVREFSRRLSVNPSVLVRALQRMDLGRPVTWLHVERILRAAGLTVESQRWQRIYAWWYSTRIDG